MTRPWTSEEEGVNRHLDNVDSLLIGLSQRRLNEAQRERLARLLQRSELSVLDGARSVAPCPGYPDKSCLVWVNGGGLCSYCRRTLELAGRVG